MVGPGPLFTLPPWLVLPPVALAPPLLVLLAPLVALAPAAPIEPSLPPLHALSASKHDPMPTFHPTALKRIPPKCHGPSWLPIPLCAMRTRPRAIVLEIRPGHDDQL
jgi:hypothetical protein